MANTQAWHDLTHALKSGQMKPLGDLYESHRSEFLSFIRKFPLSTTEGLELYQEAILTLYENVVQDKVTKYSASIKTYLFSIGKYKALNILRQRSKQVDLNETYASEKSTYEHIHIFDERPSNMVERALQALGKVCRTLLVMSYYQGIKNEVLLEQFAYKNDQTLRANKSRCLRKLREQIVILQAKL